MQTGDFTSVNPSTEDFDDSAWASMWLSGWEGWTEYCQNEAKAQVPVAPKASRRPGRRSKTAHAAAAAQTTDETKLDEANLKSNVCPICGKILSSPNALRLHNKTHEGGRPFKCEECGSRFARRDHLRVHYRVHTGERPYTCVFCGNSFAHSGTLKSHIRTHTGEKPFACEVCGVCFSDPSTLRMHRLKHVGNGNKQKKAAKTASAAKKRPAAEELLLPCDVCGRIFNSDQSLNCHMKTHAKEEETSLQSDQDKDGDCVQQQNKSEGNVELPSGGNPIP